MLEEAPGRSCALLEFDNIIHEMERKIIPLIRVKVFIDPTVYSDFREDLGVNRWRTLKGIVDPVINVVKYNKINT